MTAILLIHFLLFLNLRTMIPITSIWSLLMLIVCVPTHHSLNLSSLHLPTSQNNSNLQLSKGELTKLCSFATAQTHCLFSGNTDDQTDRVSMGSPLAAVISTMPAKNSWNTHTIVLISDSCRFSLTPLKI